MTIWRWGNHYWQIPGVFKSILDIDFRKFPFDTIEAKMEIFWLDRVQYVNVTSTEVGTVDKIWPDSALFIPDSAIWRFRQPEMAITTKLVGDKYPLTIVHYFFERRQEYYIMTIFIPTQILMALQLATFIMPPKVHDRATYSVTVNLAFTVSQQVINNQLPKTSQPIYLFYYIAIYLILGAAITIETIVMGTIWDTVQWIHRKEYGFNFEITYGRIVDISNALIVIFMVFVINIWFYHSVQ